MNCVLRTHTCKPPLASSCFSCKERGIIFIYVPRLMLFALDRYQASAVRRPCPCWGMVGSVMISGG